MTELALEVEHLTKSFRLHHEKANSIKQLIAGKGRNQFDEFTALHDVNYLWGIVAQLLFYATPIIYDANNPSIPRALRLISAHGPTGSFITAVRNVLYDLRMPSLRDFGILIVYAGVAFAFGNFAFSRLSPRFAEEM